MLRLDHWSPKKKVPPARSRFPHHYTRNPNVPKSSPEKKFPRAPARFPHPPLYRKFLCSEIQPQKKSSPGPIKVPATHRYTRNPNVPKSSPRKKSSPGPIKVPPRHAASRHGMPRPLCEKSLCSDIQHGKKKFPRPDEGSPASRHITPCRNTPRHVTSRHITSLQITSRHNDDNELDWFCLGILYWDNPV